MKCCGGYGNVAAGVDTDVDVGACRKVVDGEVDGYLVDC